jgi:hypothetical protein
MYCCIDGVEATRLRNRWMSSRLPSSPSIRTSTRQDERPERLEDRRKAAGAAPPV